jgi:PAS domain S-box-containing protein
VTEQGEAIRTEVTEMTARGLGSSNLKTTWLQQEPACEYWESIVESIGDGFWVFDHSWHCTYINNRQASLVGIPKEDVLGKNVWELFPDLVGTEVYRQLHGAVAEQTPVHFEHFSSMRQGWFELRVYPSANGVSILTIEITARKQAEEVWRESEGRFQAFMNHSPIAAFIKDEAGRYIYIKSLVESLFQYTPDELVGKTDFDLLPLEVAQQLRANDAAVLAGGKAIQVPETIQLEDGEQHFMSFKFPFQDASGRKLLAGVAMDISDRIQAEEALREQEQRYRRIFETTGVSIWEEDFTEVKAAIDRLKAQGVQDFRQYFAEHPEFVRQAVGMVRVVNVNQATVRMFGAQDKQKILNSLAQIFVPETLEVFVGELLAIAQEQTFFEAETILKTLQGELLNVIFTITFGPPTAKFDSVLVSIMNITDRKRAENALRESEIQLQRANERFELAVAAVNCLIYDWDVQQDIVYRTEGLTQILGYSLEEAEPTSQWWTERIHPEDLQRVQNETELALANSDRCTVEYRVRNKDNQYVYVIDHGLVTRDADGRIMRLVGSTIDITERKQAEAERERLLQRERAANELLQLFIEHAPAAVAMLDRQMRYLFTSRRWLQEYGSGYTSLTGLCHYDVVPDIPEGWRDVHQRCLAGATERRKEDYFVRADGSAICLHWEVLPWYTSGGDIGGIIIFAENITDRKQAEQEREQLLERERVAREQAENANRLKDEFLAVLSHELRSPLNPILGWAKLLRSRNFDDKAADRALETIERNAKLQTQLIEDLLDVSRILQGKMVLDTSAVNLATTIEAALETVRLAASAKDIQIQTVLDANVGNVSGDSNRLQQVVWNLVSNAVKFTPSRGWVEVRLEQVGGDAQIQVRDNGKGISPEFLPHVFEYFRQADGTTTRAFGGLGLGLAIVRHLVELHGGSVLADSPGEGLGATFTVRLPLMETSPEVPQEVPSDSFGDLGGLHVLIVDDEADIRDLVAFILEQAGAEVTVATSASEALAVLNQSLPGVLLCDIGMPEVDGYMLMRQVRALPPERGGLIRAIALTAYAGESNQKQALTAGFQLHISKPVEPEELVIAIAQLIATDK